MIPLIFFTYTNKYHIILYHIQRTFFSSYSSLFFCMQSKKFRQPQCLCYSPFKNMLEQSQYILYRLSTIKVTLNLNTNFIFHLLQSLHIRPFSILLYLSSYRLHTILLICQRCRPHYCLRKFTF